MSRLLKCYGEECQIKNIKHPSDKLSKLSGKNYCPKCYDIERTNRDNRDAVYRVIAHAYGLQMPTTLMKKHVKDMHENYGWSYKRILALADYVFNKKKIKMLDMKYGVKHLENYHQEMNEYYIKRKKQKEQTKQTTLKRKTIIVNKSFNDSNKYKDSKIVNMEDL